MAVILTLTGKTPNNIQFGLDTFTEHYKCDATADVVLTDAGVPQMGDAHPDYAFMFITSRPCSESGESASALDLIYTGCLTDDGDGNPIFRPGQHTSGTDVQSASSSFGSGGGVLTGAVTAQFYAPTTSLSYFSFAAAGTSEVDPPIAAPVIITVQVGDSNFAPGTTIADIATTYFSTQTVHSLNSSEIVAGKYWQNLSRKTTVFIPFLISVAPGTAFVTLAAPGTNYQVGNTLTITSGGESAVLVVTAIGPLQGIVAFSTSANTFTTPHDLLVPSGGSGTDALFNVIIT